MAQQTIVNAQIVIAGAAPAPEPLDIEILGVTLTGPQAAAWAAEYGANLIVEVAKDTWADVMDTLGITDGEATYEYLQLSFSQTPFPRLIQLGRRATPVAQVVNFDLGDPGAATDGLYRITLNGQNADVNAIAQTRTQVVTSMLAAIALLTTPVTGAPGADTEQIDVTADEAGVPFSFAASAPDPDAWLVTVTTPNEGFTADIDLWEAERKARGLEVFYMPVLAEAVSEGLAEAVAQFCAGFARPILSVLRTDTATDPDALNGTGIAPTLAAFNYSRLALFTIPTATDYDHASIIARRLPTLPGSTTWGNVLVSGVDGEYHTSTEDGVLIAGPYAYFDRIDSLGGALSRNVRVLDGTNLFIIRGADYLKLSVEADLLGLLAREDKIPFTGAGYGQIGATISSTLSRFVDTGFIPATRENGTPGYSVFVPPVPGPGDANRINGIAVGFSFVALLGGSVERIFPVDGLLIQ